MTSLSATICPLFPSFGSKRFLFTRQETIILAENYYLLSSAISRRETSNKPYILVCHSSLEQSLSLFSAYILPPFTTLVLGMSTWTMRWIKPHIWKAVPSPQFSLAQDTLYQINNSSLPTCGRYLWVRPIAILIWITTSAWSPLSQLLSQCFANLIFDILYNFYGS